MRPPLHPILPILLLLLAPLLPILAAPLPPSQTDILVPKGATLNARSIPELLALKLLGFAAAFLDTTRRRCTCGPLPPPLQSSSSLPPRTRTYRLPFSHLKIATRSILNPISNNTLSLSLPLALFSIFLLITLSRRTARGNEERAEAILLVHGAGKTCFALL
ncbi:hypothetical protein BDR22DRAFT_281004 [Usnea florida]